MTDKREFEKVFRHHYDGMFRLARKMLNDDAESKDVVSDVFANLLKSNTDLKSDTLQAFLLTSVRNRCINLLVHKQKQQQMQKAVVVEMMLSAGAEVPRDSPSTASQRSYRSQPFVAVTQAIKGSF